MGFNTDPDDLRRSIQRQEVAKRRLERTMAVEVRRMLREMGFALEESVIEAGQPINAMAWEDEVNRILAVNYAKAGQEFGGLIDEHVATNDMDDALVAAVAAAALGSGSSANSVMRGVRDVTRERFAEFTQTTVPERSQDITATSNRQLTRAVNDAFAASEAADEPFSPEQLGTAARRNWLSSSLFRGDLIAETEIQNAAESAKAIESDSFMGEVAVAAGATLLLTRESLWATMGDDKVRPSHVEADFQVRVGGQPFDVGGFQLRYPGDNTLGAPLTETARCRCQRNDIIDGQPV